MKRQTFQNNLHYYTYVLLSLKDNEFYIGYTNNLRNRLIEHAKGLVDATQYRRPLKLIHYEYFINEKDAKAREVFLKSGYGHKQLKTFMKNTLISLRSKF